MSNLPEWFIKLLTKKAKEQGVKVSIISTSQCFCGYNSDADKMGAKNLIKRFAP